MRISMKNPASDKRNISVVWVFVNMPDEYSSSKCARVDEVGESVRKDWNASLTKYSTDVAFSYRGVGGTVSVQCGGTHDMECTQRGTETSRVWRVLDDTFIRQKLGYGL